MSELLPDVGCTNDPANCGRPEGECPCMYHSSPFDKLDAAAQSKLVEYVRDLGEGPGDLSTTEFEARGFLRALSEAELQIYLQGVGKRPPWLRKGGARDI